ncbi:putative disintegrin and metalloproteinase with thrombospondin motif adt-1 [Trichinella spiralis]|uniref:Disintegrin and metalloproteinase with thrombospondin motif adt-1 n=2 Tax=Trichinella spiralis TaxID=6334 RepID=A0ABR3KZT2_TRISP
MLMLELVIDRIVAICCLIDHEDHHSGQVGVARIAFCKDNIVKAWTLERFKSNSLQETSPTQTDDWLVGHTHTSVAAELRNVKIALLFIHFNNPPKSMKPSVVIVYAQLFSAFFSILVYADVGCVEEEANHIVVDEKPDETLTTDAPHICIATCMKATSLPCRVAVFVRKTESSNGTCELYSKSATYIKTQAQNFNVDGGAASVFKLLKHCPSVDKNMSALATARGGQKVVNVEGRTGYGASVQMYNTGWGPWSEWSACVTTQSCGSAWSVQNRIRVCSVCGQNRAIEVESRPCECCEATWRTWGPWSACSATCGPGTMVRERECEAPTGCTGAYQETGVCNLGACAAWSPWNEWGSCSATCGDGFQERQRICVGTGQCYGPARDQQRCPDLPPCCTQWSAWCPCSTTCGPGEQTRTRQCGTTTDAYNAELVETRPCNLRPCPYWLPWTSWTPCSVTCGIGTTLRSRMCQDGTAGIDCIGPDQESQQCDAGPCPAWTNWGPWTPCSVPCGTGERTRQRTCSYGTDCPGESYQVKPCYLCNCPSWSMWNPWEDCDQNTGMQTRIRYCCGSCTETSTLSCPGEAEEATSCMVESFAAAAVSPYIFAKTAIDVKWTDWTVCNATCGEGVQSRRKICEEGIECAEKVEQRKCQGPPCDGYADKRFQQFYLSRRKDRVDD